jgi:hypothetical protein
MNSDINCNRMLRYNIMKLSSEGSGYCEYVTRFRNRTHLSKQDDGAVSITTLIIMSYYGLGSYVGLHPCASTIRRAATVIIIAAAKGEAQ